MIPTLVGLNVCEVFSQQFLLFFRDMDVWIKINSCLMSILLKETGSQLAQLTHLVNCAILCQSTVSTVTLELPSPPLDGFNKLQNNKVFSTRKTHLSMLAEAVLASISSMQFRVLSSSTLSKPLGVAFVNTRWAALVKIYWEVVSVSMLRLWNYWISWVVFLGTCKGQTMVKSLDIDPGFPLLQWT